MKITSLLIFLGCMQVSAKVYSQENTVTLNMENVEIAKALRAIEKKSNYRFLYNDALLSPSMKVNIHATDAPVQEVVSHILSGTPLTYKLIGTRLIVIAAKSSKIDAVHVSGKVADSTGKALVGVTIQVKGTTMGTVTDPNGNFSIDVPDSAVLIVSYVGYATKEVPVNGQSEINITLYPSHSALNEVVVVGYGSQAKKDITGAVSVVSAADIANRPIVNVSEALQGKASGVQVVSNSGKPGAGLTVRIRGSSSISAGNNPLYVVDGIPTTDISAYSPDDIASITVLKDAASAAIYGTRAANGVIIITTKKGIAGKPRIHFNAYYGTTSTTKKLAVLNAKQYQDYMNESYGPGTITDSMVQANNINWPDQVFRQGNQQGYELSFSGGSEKTTHFISLNYMDQVGMIRPSLYNRVTGRINLTNKAANWLTLTTSTLISRAKDNDVKDNASVARGGVVLSALTTPPTVPKYNADGTIGQNPLTGWENPLGAIVGAKTKNNQDRLVSNISAEIKFTKGLVFKSNWGIDYQNYMGTYFEDPWLIQDGRNNKGQLSENKSQQLVWLSEQTLSYTATWGNSHFSALAGWTAQASHWDQTSIYARDLDTQYRHKDWATMFDLAHTKTAPSKSIDNWALISYLGRITYDYKDKYLLQANLRSDHSSKFAPGNRVATFPSFSVGWRISEEDFMKTIPVITDLKLRASWGQNGNQEGIGSFEYLSLNNINPQDGSISPATIAPEDLRWETTTQADLGLDATLFNGRLSFTADIYKKKTKNVLVRVPLSGQIVSSVLMNSGTIQNIGEEFVISSKNIQSGNFNWNTDFNISFNKNKVLDIGNGLTFMNTYGYIYERGYAVALVQGYGLGEFYGYVAAGVDPQTGVELYETKDGKKLPYPDVKPSDRRLIGSAQPNFVYGMTNDFSYKNFDLTLFLQGSQGNDIFDGVRVETEGMKDSRNQSTAILHRWKKPGDITNMPGVSPASNDNSVISTRFLENGSYLRFKTITLAYKFNPALINHIGLSEASVYVSGQNLITFTKYQGFDPEVNTYGGSGGDNSNIAMGIDYGAYPQAKMVLFGLNITLK